MLGQNQLEWNFSGFFSVLDFELKKNSTRLSNLHPRCPDDHFEEKKFFGKIPLYYNIFELQYFRASGEQQSAVLANVLSKRPSEHFEEKDVFWKKYISLMLSELELKDSDRKFETAFYISTGTFRGKFCLVGKFNFLLSFPRCRQKIFGTFTNPIGGVVQLAFFDSTGTCWGKCSLVENVYKFSSVLDSEQKKNTASVSKKYFECP